MIQKTCNGELITPTLEEFIMEAGPCVPSTDEAFRNAIVQEVDRLFSHGDFWSLRAVLQVLRILSEDYPPRGYGPLFALYDVVNSTAREDELIAKYRRAFHKEG